MTLSNGIDLLKMPNASQNEYCVWFLTGFKTDRSFCMEFCGSQNYGQLDNEQSNDCCAECAWMVVEACGTWTMNMQTHSIADTYVVPKIIRSILWSCQWLPFTVQHLIKWNARSPNNIVHRTLTDARCYSLSKCRIHFWAQYAERV